MATNTSRPQSIVFSEDLVEERTSHDYKQEKETTTEKSSDRDCRERYSDITGTSYYDYKDTTTEKSSDRDCRERYSDITGPGHPPSLTGREVFGDSALDAQSNTFQRSGQRSVLRSRSLRTTVQRQGEQPGEEIWQRPLNLPSLQLGLESDTEDDIQGVYHQARRARDIEGLHSQLTSPVPEYSFMEDSNSFHGAITAQEAIKRLQVVRGDYYITRFSSANKSYVLSVLKRNPRKCGHFKLIINRKSRRKYRVNGMERYFQNIDELLTHYEIHRIHPEFDNIGRRLTTDAFAQLSERSTCVIL